MKKRFKEFIYKKNIIKASIIIILLSAIAFMLCANFITTSYETVNTTYNVETDSINVQDYDVNENFFTPSAEDPKLHITTSNNIINKVRLKFSAPLNKTLSCQIFYPNPSGEITESGSIKGFLVSGKTDATFTLPEGAYNYLRIDIDGEFSLESISLLNVTVHNKIQGLKFNYILFIILFIINCLLAILYIIYEKHIISYSLATVKKPWFKRLIISAIFACILFRLLSAFWNQYWFVSDEVEIFMHGQAIANGELLYRDTASQHTPIMYYISAIFSLLGVTTITGFRLCFYAVISALWGLMYFRYSERRGKLSVILYPLLYICILAQLDWTATCILSDQFQGIGMAILFFEFLEFNEKRDLNISNCVMISLSVLISFGTAFVAAFAIAIMAATVIALDIWNCIKEKKDIKSAWSELWRRYVKLFSIVLAPIAVLLLFYICTGTLDDLIAWTYTINRTVYTNYTGGYGSSIINGFLGGRVHYLELLKFTSFNALTFCKLLLILLSIAYIVHLAKKGNGSVIRVVGMLLFMFACATRGLFDFHGLPAVALICSMSACFVGEVLIPSIKGKALPIALTITCSIVMFLPYYQNIFPNRKTISTTNDISVGSTAWYIDKITDDGERVGFSLLNCDLMVLGKVIPATVQAGSVPWFWDFAGEEAMEELNAEPPRVFLFSPGHEVWGHKITDYAPDLVEFIQSNYTCLDYIGQPVIWVHNSYIDEVNQKINDGSYYLSDN